MYAVFPPIKIYGLWFIVTVIRRFTDLSEKITIKLGML